MLGCILDLSVKTDWVYIKYVVQMRKSGFELRSADIDVDIGRDMTRFIVSCFI